MVRRCCLLVAGLLASSLIQAQDLPRELNGRWNWQGRATQVFSLEDIQRKDDQSFTAKLTWWTRDTKCAIRGEPITGRLTAAGLGFDSVTKCGDAFTAELQPTQGGWNGFADTKGAHPIRVELSAQ
jgi:hypothetical protein